MTKPIVFIRQTESDVMLVVSDSGRDYGIARTKSMRVARDFRDALNAPRGLEGQRIEWNIKDVVKPDSGVVLHIGYGDDGGVSLLVRMDDGNLVVVGIGGNMQPVRIVERDLVPNATDRTTFAHRIHGVADELELDERHSELVAKLRLVALNVGNK